MNLAVLGLLIGTSALGSITATVSPSGSGSVVINSSNDITFTRNFVGGTCDLYIRGTPSDNARFVQMVGANAGYETRVHILGDPAQGATRFGNVYTVLKQSAAHVHLNELVSAGDLGTATSSDMAISVDSIQSIDVSGSVYRPIQATSSTIGSILIGGDLKASVLAHDTQGSITELRVTGNIGSSSGLVSVSYGQFLGTLRGASIWADVYSGDTVTRRIQNITTTSGAFTGSIQCLTLDDPSTSSQSGLVIAGQLNANVTVSSSCSEEIAMSSLASGKTIKINGSVTTPIAISSTAGLNGQIVVNANNGSGDWTGSLTVGSTTASPTRYYTNTNLGTGAVGLVPYHLHGAACYPPLGAVVPVPSPSVPLRYTFYGPVKTSGYPVFVSYRPTGTSTWTDITGLFSYSISGRSVLISQNSSYWLEDGYDYQILPNTTLLCDGLTTTSDVNVYASPYTFSVVGPLVCGECD